MAIAHGGIPEGLAASLSIPNEARAIVVFARASAENTASARLRYFADRLNEARYATLVVDLLARWEARIDRVTAEYRFDIQLLAQRLVHATKRVHASFANAPLPIAYLGLGTGAAAALVAAAIHPKAIYAVVSRDGRPDLAGGALPRVAAPVLLIVSPGDSRTSARNQDAQRAMQCRNELRLASNEAPALAADWFGQALGIEP